MNDEYDEINNRLHEQYKAYLESLSIKELIEKIQDRDPVGKGDINYEQSN